MKILVADDISEKGLSILREAPQIEYDYRPTISAEELLEAIVPYEGLIVRSRTQVTEQVLDAARSLKIVGRAGVGVDNVDLDAATQRGVIVMNAPTGNVITTAEHTIALLLAVSRFVPQATASVKSGRWDRGRFTGTEVADKVLGIIGFGRIGSLVARKAAALDMVPITHDPYISSQVTQQRGIPNVGLEELLHRSDFLSLHVPKNAETTHMIDEPQFYQMKEGVRIINCARGGLINEDALYKAIIEGKVAGAALDVYENEPPVGSPLLSLEQVICTPHLGASTYEAQENVAISIAKQMVGYFTQGQIVNAVNVPTLDAETLAQIGPYLGLAEKLGSFQGQMLEGGVRRVSIEYSGEIAQADTRPLTVAVLKGMLQSFLSESVNIVNARPVARDRGIQVVETNRGNAEDYTSLISVEVTTDSSVEVVAGTLFQQNDPRIVRINDFRLEALPLGWMLITYNIDRPGVIGNIGTILGRNAVNIAGMQLGRTRPGEDAVSIFNVDSALPPGLLEEIRRLPNIRDAKTIQL